MKMLGATKNCGRWSHIEAVKWAEIILVTAMLERILSINVLKLSSIKILSINWNIAFFTDWKLSEI